MPRGSAAYWLELGSLDHKVSGFGSALGMLFPGRRVFIFLLTSSVYERICFITKHYTYIRGQITTPIVWNTITIYIRCVHSMLNAICYMLYAILYQIGFRVNLLQIGNCRRVYYEISHYAI